MTTQQPAVCQNLSANLHPASCKNSQWCGRKLWTLSTGLAGFYFFVIGKSCLTDYVASHCRAGNDRLLLFLMHIKICIIMLMRFCWKVWKISFGTFAIFNPVNSGYLLRCRSFDSGFGWVKRKHGLITLQLCQNISST